MSGYGFHWTPCRGGGGGGGIGALTLVAVLVVIAAAVEAAMPVIIEAVEIVALVIVSVIGAGVLALLAVAGVRVRRRMLAGRPVRAVVVASAEPVGGAERAGLPGRVVPALLRADVSALPRGEAYPHVVTGRAARPRCAHRERRRS